MVKAIYRYRLGIHLEVIHVIHISGVSVKESLVVSNRNWIWLEVEKAQRNRVHCGLLLRRGRDHGGSGGPGRKNSHMVYTILSSWDESAPVTFPTPFQFKILGGDPVSLVIGPPLDRESKDILTSIFDREAQSARISHFQAGETIINAEKWTLWNTENRKREGSRSSGSRWLWSPGRMFWVVCKSHFQKKKKKHALLPEAEVAFHLAVCLSVRPSREGPAHIAVSHRQSSSTHRNSCL